MTKEPEIDSAVDFWAELDYHNNVLRSLAWMLKKQNLEPVPVEDFMADGLGKIIEQYLDEQKRIVYRFALEVEEELNEEENTNV